MEGVLSEGGLSAHRVRATRCRAWLHVCVCARLTML